MRFNRLSMIVVTMAIGLASVAAVAPGVSAQTALPVRQGQTIRVGTVLGGETATVDPVNAGTLSIQGIPGDFVTVDFTASTTYLGPAAIRWTNFAGEAQVAQFVVSGGTSSARATFTPRPAPGPCILIAAGGTVDFDVGTIPKASIRYYSHRLGIGSGSTPGDGSAFNATVTFLAASE